VNLKLLDIGCGTGALLHVAGNVKDYGYRIKSYGVELDKKVAEQVQLKSKRPVVSCNLLTHDLRVDGFDLIFMNDVLEHISNPDVYLYKVHGLMSTNSLLVVEMPSRSTVQYMRGGPEWKHIKFEHLWYFYQHELEWLLTRNGFSIVTSKYPVAGRMTIYARKDQ
jgi:2-polyprenyl-3-methyl-5-hydroxy-6-metoxy-1,4-benzoquinol methylase